MSRKFSEEAYCAYFVEQEPGGNAPRLNPEDMSALVTPGELILYADNPAEMVNATTGSLIIEVYRDHWHIAEVW